MNRDEMIKALADVRDELVREQAQPIPVTVAARPDTGPVRPGAPGRLGAHRALMTMLAVLDSWIEGQKVNHQALEHRHENRGEECWRLWAPSDIRRMVNDAAREIGLDVEFADPEILEEDKPL